jgi:mRNA interferase MazF
VKDHAPGDVVLLAFPFADGSATRRRPALVLVDVGDDDLLVARITSRPARTDLDVTLDHWQAAGLLLPSVVRVHKVATLEKELVEQKLGTLAPEDRSSVLAAIRGLCSQL